MKVYVYRFAGDRYRLAQEERTPRTPEPGEVAVRIRATSLNYRDLITLNYLAGRKVDGRIPLSDGVGEVIAVGPGVSHCKPGDRVAGCFFQTWESGRFELRHHQHDLGGSIDGMLAEEVILLASGVVRVPDYLSDEEAACLPCAAVTAWVALMSRGHLKASDTVLTLGTGGVSIFALQFAVAVGARVVITSSDDEKLRRASELGAAYTINYRTHPDWEKQVWQWTGQRGVDHVIELGGAGTLGKSLASTAAGGTVSLIGVLTGFGPPTDSLFPLLARNLTLNGIYVGSHQDFEAMNAFLTAKAIRPTIDRVFPFSEAEAAFDYLASARHFGKVVIRVAE